MKQTRKEFRPFETGQILPDESLGKQVEGETMGSSTVPQLMAAYLGRLDLSLYEVDWFDASHAVVFRQAEGPELVFKIIAEEYYGYEKSQEGLEMIKCRMYRLAQRYHESRT